MSLMSASELGLLYGELEIFSGITLEVPERARIGIVGPNGGGKTSLLRLLVGELTPNGGAVHRPAGLRIGYVPQLASKVTAGSLGDEVMTAFAELRNLEDELASSAMEIERADAVDQRKAARRYSSLLQRYEALGGSDYRNLMERATTGVGLSSEVLETPASAASGGERTRAALATALLTDPDLLVLDEPTNYLDFDGLAWLETFLGRFSHSFLIVSHDRYFLDKVVSQVWELDKGKLQVFRGDYTKYRALKIEQSERQRREYERQQEYIEREEAFIRRYRAGQRAREARGRATRLERLKRIDAPSKEAPLRIDGASADRTGQIVVSTRDLKVGFSNSDEDVLLLSVPDLQLERQSRTVIVGANGAGKSTLIQTLLGHIPSLSGQASLGHNVQVGYQRQGHYDLPKSSTVLDALLDARNLPIEDARSYLAVFLFTGDDVFAPVSSLSGGERTRLALARLLITEPNFLVLDEPTTHLDIPSREALERVLLSFPGTLLVVSHDRQLISTLARQLWIIEGGSIHPFAGTFDEWVQRRQEETRPAPKPRKRSRSHGAPRSKARPKGKRVPGPPDAPNPEEVIAGMESRLVEIERELESASQRQDVAQIALLGQEYQTTQTSLEQALDEWGR